MNTKDKIDFIGIGSMKAGSTWVSACLEEHPDILFSGNKSEKELRFFNSDDPQEYPRDSRTNYDKGLEWYQDQFPASAEGKIRGEFSVYYLSDRLAPARIKEYFPDTKIIAVLRDPVGMIHSYHWYCNFAINKDVPEDFKEAVEKGLYLDKGMYYKHLKEYYELFPKENIYVILLDDIKKDSKKVAHDLFKYLGVNPNFEPSVLTTPVNEAARHRSGLLKKISHSLLIFLNKVGLGFISKKLVGSSVLYSAYSRVNVATDPYPKMDGEMGEKLRKHFRSDVENLEKLIGRDLSAWK